MGKKIVDRKVRYFNQTRTTTLGIPHGKTSTELNKGQVITDAAGICLANGVCRATTGRHIGPMVFDVVETAFYFAKSLFNKEDNNKEVSQEQDTNKVSQEEAEKIFDMNK